MAASVTNWKKTGDALADAMAALHVDLTPKLADMQKDGWFSARQFAERAGVHVDNARKKIERSGAFDRATARDGRYTVRIYRLRK